MASLMSNCKQDFNCDDDFSGLSNTCNLTGVDMLFLRLRGIVEPAPLIPNHDPVNLRNCKLLFILKLPVRPHFHCRNFPR